MTLELRLLLTCARVLTTQEDETAIRQMLDDGIDWTIFARKAIDHELAILAGHTLARVAPDMVPDDILDAFRATIEQTRRKNRALFNELVRLTEALANNGVDAIPFKGPVLTIQAYGDLGLRLFQDLDILIREPDMARTIATLGELGYERKGRSTEAQIEAIQRLQGKDFLYRKDAEIGVEPNTRLTPAYMALDIDYAGLWRRARRTNLSGRTMLTLSPEDDLLVLAILGGKDLWRKIKWACDVAALLGSQPKLDWLAVVERARAQGCLRMVLLAVSLACRYFHATVPDAVAAAERADPVIARMVQRIMMRWQADEPIVAPSNKTLSTDRLRLHDGVGRRARYMARTLLMPGTRHVTSRPLPKGLSFAYVPMGIAHDIIALPLQRAHRQFLARARRLLDALASRNFALALMLAPAGRKPSIRRNLKTRADAKRALAANPNNGAAWRNLGHALFELKRYKQAILSYDKALVLVPDHWTVWKNRAAALEAINEKDELPEVLNSQDADSWTVRAGALWYAQRYTEASEASDRVLSLDPGRVAAMRMGINSRLQSCNWSKREDDKLQITTGLKAGSFVVKTVDHRGLCDSEEELQIAAQLTAKEIPPAAKPLWHGERYRHDKIRLAYMSTDFRVHAVASLIVGCFEHHDKTRFETTAVSLHPGDKSEIRRRIVSSFDRVIAAQRMTDADVARMLRELEIDIMVDLNGFTGEMRGGILARRPAPVQVNYLGYPGTMGVPFIDYIIADQMVIPKENQIHYSEKVVYLPHAYLPNDRLRPIAEKTPSRIEVELPETGFVFACLNHSYKIGPEIFDVWMRLLRAVDGSVLWLRTTNTAAMSNLRGQAEARGVTPDRLVFAPPVSRPEDHLARLRVADLFLDTRPYNAHATACDALWSGLPVVTCPGNTFPGRVAASLLHAIGLPELVAPSLDEYEKLALALAQNPERLAAIRAKLMRNRDTEPLFDTARFTRYLESAYTTMWERQQADLPPASFVVASAL